MIFEKRLRESIQLDIMPKDLACSPYFALDSSSDILSFFKKQCAQEKKEREELEMRMKVSNEA